jgi:hypothetical protein
VKRQTLKGYLDETSAQTYGRIFNLTPRERRAALRALDKLTTTNCSWHLYAMRDVLRDFIDCATPRREKRRRERRAMQKPSV